MSENSDQSQDAYESLLQALAKLPHHGGLTYRGLTDESDVPTAPLGLRTLLPTSRDPKVASANGTLPLLLAVQSRTGRALGPLSASPEEHEVVLLPGTVLVPVTSVVVGELGLKVVVLDEAPTEHDAEPIDAAQLLGRAVADVYAAAERPAVTSGNLAKFAGPLA